MCFIALSLKYMLATEQWENYATLCVMAALENGKTRKKCKRKSSDITWCACWDALVNDEKHNGSFVCQENVRISKFHAKCTSHLLVFISSMPNWPESEHSFYRICLRHLIFPPGPNFIGNFMIRICRFYSFIAEFCNSILCIHCKWIGW